MNSIDAYPQLALWATDMTSAAPTGLSGTPSSRRILALREPGLNNSLQFRGLTGTRPAFRIRLLQFAEERHESRKNYRHYGPNHPQHPVLWALLVLALSPKISPRSQIPKAEERAACAGSPHPCSFENHFERQYLLQFYLNGQCVTNQRGRSPFTVCTG